MYSTAEVTNTKSTVLLEVFAMLHFHHDLSQGWYLTTLSSLLCALGCFVIYLDDLYELIFPASFTRRYPFHLKENYRFMNGSLAFSSGCLLFTALYRLLPEARAYLEDNSAADQNRNLELVLAFIGGIAVCFLFNFALHLVTAESVVHCSHDGEGKVETILYPRSEENHSHTHTAQDHGHLHSHSHEPEAQHVEEASGSHLHEDETMPLLSRKRSSIIHFFSHADQDERLLGECKGYSSAEQCVHDHSKALHFCELPQLCKDAPVDEEEEVLEPVTLARQDVHSQHGKEDHHHHHVNLPLSRLMLIGIQTILAITLHKFPEGFITYITLETNPELGLSIFLSLLIHNFTEGFLMCLPLYYLFTLGEVKWNKFKAVSISALLGGFSQPLGALGGYLFLKVNESGGDDIDLGRLNYVFGITMAVTSGFLSLIAMSMYGSAVSFSGSPNFVLVWCVVGMSVIGLLTAFVST